MSHLFNNLRINSSGIARHPRDWKWDTLRHGGKDFDLWAALRGKGIFRSEGQEYPFSRGDCFLLHGDNRYVGTSIGDGDLDNLFIHFDFLDESGKIFKPSRNKIPVLTRRIFNFDLLETMLRRIVQYWEEGKKDAAGTWLSAVLFELDRVDRIERLSGLEREQAVAVERICAEIREHPGRPYPIAELADKMYYTPDHFARVFRKYTGARPQEYIINRRIDRAKTFLLTSSFSVSRIADLLGYRDVYFFSKQFKEKAGVSPRRYRQG